MQKKIFFNLFIILLLAGAVVAQPVTDKNELEKERQELQKELKEMQGAYDKIKGQSKQALGQLSLLNRKINLQERYINSISKEIKMIDDDLYLSNLEIYRLQRQLDTLKSEYAKSLVYAYKNRSSYDYLNFIFSASSFNDAIKRVSYLKSYRNYRENQAKTIFDTKEQIAKRQQQQLGRKEQKNVALKSQTKEKSELDVQKKEKDVVVTKLKSQEKDLQKQINAKRKRDRDLQNAVLAIVRRDIENAKRKAKEEADAKKKAEAVTKKTEDPSAPVVGTNPGTVVVNPKRNEPNTRPTSYLDLNANDVALNNKFELNRAKLPWPVDNGIVTMHFGITKIENTLLSFDNPGITIATPSAGVSVKAVFDGEISGISNMGDGMLVTIRHGKYYTTYSNLSSITIAKGDQVKTGQQIGKAGREENGNGGQIDFMLMIETKNVNPEPWLRR